MQWHCDIVASADAPGSLGRNRYRQLGIGSDEFFADFDEEGDECPGGLDDEWGVEMGSGGKTVIM